MIIPYGALPGFSLSVARREIAAHYGVRARSLMRRGRRRTEQEAEARDALCWKMLTRHGWTASRLGKALGCSARTVTASAERHAAIIEEFRVTHDIKEAA